VKYVKTEAESATDSAQVLRYMPPAPSFFTSILTAE